MGMDSFMGVLDSYGKRLINSLDVMIRGRCMDSFSAFFTLVLEPVENELETSLKPLETKLEPKLEPLETKLEPLTLILIIIIVLFINLILSIFKNFYGIK
jgi:hypothetical protein